MICYVMPTKRLNEATKHVK